MTVVVLATGGTIASRYDPATDAVVPAVDPATLLDAVPGLEELGPFTVEEVARVNGWNVDPARMVDVARAARRALEDGADAVLVTHGTDTVEETAYMVDLLAGPATDRGPVVLACAMRAAGEVGADGPRNLLDGARVARAPSSRGRGALLVANGDVHCARWVTKTDTVHVSTFRSVPGGPVGRVTGAGVAFALPTPPRPPAGERVELRVELVKACSGMDDELLRWIVDHRHPAGIVVEGTGAGNVPGSLVPGIAHALGRGIPVVVASRCWTGRTEPIYGGPGGGATLRDLGAVGAGDLPSAKARIALMVALGVDPTVDGVRRWFDGA